VLNSHYSIAEGSASQDIVPTLVFDDGRFTYIRFPGNREVPAVFHVLPDGSETLVNTRMEDDLLVVDRVSRRLMLRAGQAVVGVWNEAFDSGWRPSLGWHHGTRRGACSPRPGQRTGNRCFVPIDRTLTMNAPSDRDPPPRPDGGAPDEPQPDGGTMQPLPGEAGIPDVAAPPRPPMSRKGLLAAALFLLTLVALVGFSIARFAASGRKADDVDAKLAGGRPSAATAEARRLDMTPPSAPKPSAPAATRIPALEPTTEELAEPIGVRRTEPSSRSSSSGKSIPPEDAPVLLVSARPGAASVRTAAQSLPPGTGAIADQEEDPAPDALDGTRRNLEGYQRQLQGLLDTLTRSTAAATGTSPAAPPAGVPPIGGPPLGVPTPGTASPMLGNRSLTLPKGTAFTCALKTKVISATSGLVGCQVLRNVFSDDGRVLLIERGSHLDGEYRIASVRPGTVRIPVLWTRIRTPHGVTVDIDSPGTGQLGESGIDGYVDNRWPERIGAAMLVSLIDDSVQLVIQNQANDVQGDTIVLPSTTSSTSKLAEKVLESTINIPPLIYQNQGGIVGIYVARDVDFSSVYELKPVAR
jgi:type IV secretion system protein VirB10